ncbi:MAG TPA: response regulator, partial [Thermoanaerobaculia bacterium]|nr:response regulator [Thermoanaerobaculia bacterium]
MAKAPSETGILVVEDDPAIRRLVRMVLQRRGYQVETAEDGVEAVLKLGIGEYDAVILDLMMPNLDGFALID